MIQEEQEEQASLEDARMRYTIAATNPALYTRMFGRDEEFEGDGVEWRAPRTPEEVDEFLALINDQHVGQEE